MSNPVSEALKNNEIITPMQIAEQKALEAAINRWHHSQSASERGYTYLVPLSGAGFLVSFLASLGTSTWFIAFTGVTFIAAVVAGIAALILEVTRRTSIRPSNAKADKYNEIRVD